MIPSDRTDWIGGLSWVGCNPFEVGMRLSGVCVCALLPLGGLARGACVLARGAWVLAWGIWVLARGACVLTQDLACWCGILAREVRGGLAQLTRSWSSVGAGFSCCYVLCPRVGAIEDSVEDAGW